MPRLTPDLKERVIDLQSRQTPQRKIAALVGVDTSTVSRFLRRYNKALFERLVKDGEAIRAKQVQQLERIAEQAESAWRKSTRDAETVEVTEERPAGSAAGVAGIEPGRVKTVTRGQSGDSSFLREKRAALADIRAILGLDAPKKSDVTSGGRPIGRPVFVDVVPPAKPDDGE